MKKLAWAFLGFVLVAGALPALPDPSVWVAVETPSGLQCQKVDDGTLVPQGYPRKTNATQSCKGMGWLWDYLTGNTAQAATYRVCLAGTTNCIAPNGTINTSCATAACAPTVTALAWDDSCLDGLLAPIATQNTGTATSIDVTSCKTGTNAGSATITLHTAVTNWSVPSGVLTHAGSATGNSVSDGSIVLDLCYMGDCDPSTPYAWEYLTASGTDVTAPTPPRSLAVTLDGSNHPVLTFDPPTDPWTSTAQPVGLKDYQVLRGTSAGSLSVIATTAFAGPGISPQLTCEDVGTLSPVGTSNQSGADWTLTAEGQVGEASPTSDEFRFCHTTVSGAFVSYVTVASMTGSDSVYAKSGIHARETTGGRVRYVDAQARQGGALRQSYRDTADASGAVCGALNGITYPQILRLERASNGTTFTVSYGTDGNTFTNLCSGEHTLPVAAEVGLYATSTSNGVVETATLQSFSLQPSGVISYTDTTAANGTTYYYALKARDNNNNTSSQTAAVSVTTGTPPSGIAKRWRPGNYKHLSKGNSTTPSTWASECTSISGTNVAGILFLANSNQIWTGNGTYNWTYLDQGIAACAAVSKVAFLHVFDRSYSSAPAASSCPMPAYVKALDGNTGCFTIGTGGAAAIWKPVVMDEVIRFYKAIAARYDDNPGFGGLIPPESTPGFSGYAPPADHSAAAYNTQLARMYAEVGAVMYKSIFSAHINYVDGSATSDVVALLTAARDIQGMVSGPDTFPQAPATPCVWKSREPAKQAYLGQIGGHDFSTEMASAFLVESPEMGGFENAPTTRDEGCTVAEFHTEHETMKQSITMWQNQESNANGGITWTTNILPAIQAGTVNLTHTSCPANFTGGCNSSAGY